MDAPTESEYIAALIDLHRGLNRQGPGDTDFSRRILQMLPELPAKPRIADLGCGSGAGTLLLAQHYQCQVKAVDFAAAFIEDLAARASQAELADLIVPICADMGALDWPAASVDLLWSEGAAYNLGFEPALKCWRPLLAPGGIAVISELSWFAETSEIPEPAIAYWQAAYPLIGTEAENMARANRTGFRVLSTQRLPSQAWWANYYQPLRDRMAQMNATTPALQAVVQEMEEEMDLFEQFSQFYGYTFYILQTTAA